MKKHLLFNQSFGTEGSPNQTGETLTRENRIGLMSYLHRTLMLLLVAYIGIGQMLGADVTFNCYNSSTYWGSSNGTVTSKAAASDAYTVAFTKVGSNSNNSLSGTTIDAGYATLQIGNTINISAKSTGFTKVVIIFTEKNRGPAKNTTWSNYFTASTGTLSKTSDTEFEWTGSSSTSLTLSNVNPGSGALAFRVKTIVITPAGGSDSYAIHIGKNNANYTDESLTNTSGTTWSKTITLDAGSYYEFKVKKTPSAGDAVWYGNNGKITATTSPAWDFNTSDSNCKLYTTVAGSYTFSWDASTSKLSVTYPAGEHPTKRIYMACGSTWCDASPKFFVHSWGVTEYNTQVQESTCDGYYADIIWYNDYFQFTRNASNATAYDNNQWNVSQDLTYNSSQPKWTCTGWSDGKGTFSSSAYTPTTYTISYATGSTTATGGATISGSKASESKTCGVDFTLPSSAVFTAPGYTQTGWTTSDGGAQTHALGGSYTDNAAQTFYPVWTVNNYDLTWDLAGGTTTSTGTGIGSGVSSNTTTSQAFGTALTAPTVTKTGYNFSSWSPSVASTMPAANTTYTATFTAKTYSITLDRNGASSGSESVTMTYNSSSHTAITAPVKAGYTFDGWYDSETDDNGSGNLVMNASGVLQANVTGFTGADGIWIKDATCTLYAKWTVAASLTAISADVLYQAAGMANITFNGEDQAFTGLSSNSLFMVYGATSPTNYAAKGKNENHDVTDDISTKNFTSALYILSNSNTTSTSDPTQGAIEIITPSTAGLLYLYLDANNSLLTLKKQGTSTSTPLSGATYKAMEVDANTHYFINGSTSGKRGLYGIQYVSTYAVSITTTNVTKATGEATAIKGKAYTATFTAPVGYTLPSDATVSIGGTPQTKGTDYTWTISDGTATLTIPAAKVTGNIVVSVAGAAASTYSITYDCDGAESGCPSNVAAATNLPNPLPSAPTKDGYDFVGWYTNSTKTVAAVAGAALSENTTLYAKWTEHVTSECITITDFETSNHSKSDNKPDSEGKYFYGYKGTKDAAHAVTITATNGDCIGVNSGAELKVYAGKYVNIYADNTTTGGTPATFSNVTSVSIDAKMINSSYYTTFDIKVGETTIADDVSLVDAKSSYQTFTYDGLAQLSGKIKIINNGSGSSYNFYADNIQICTADMDACTTPTLPSLSDQTVCPGSDIEAWNAEPTNIATITGASEDVAYSWKKKGNDTEIEDEATLDLGAATESMAGTYVVTVTVSKTGYISKSASKEVTLTVTPATETPSVTASKAKVYATDEVTLTATCGSTGVTWNWYLCANSDGTGAGSSLGTSATYTIASAPAAGTYYYKAVATGDGTHSCGTAEYVYTLVVSAADACDKEFWFAKEGDRPTGAAAATHITGCPSGSSSASYTASVDGTNYTLTGSTGQKTGNVTIVVPAGNTGTLYVVVQGSSSRTITLSKGGVQVGQETPENSTWGVFTFDNLDAGTYTLVSSGNISWAMMALKLCPTVACTDDTPTAAATNATVCAGGTITITATGYETGATFQWQKQNASTSVWENIDDATSATYTVATAAAEHAGNYHIVATKNCARTSNTVTIAVPSAPVFGAVPSSVTVMQTIALSISTVEASDAVSYTWYKSADATWDAGDVEIGTDQTLIKAYGGETAGSTYYVFCRAQNACGITTSSAIAVNVTTYVEEDCATKGNEGEAQFGFENTSCSQGTYSETAVWTTNSRSKYLTYTAPEGKYLKTAKVTVAVSSGSKCGYAYSTDGGTTWTYAELASLSSTLTEKTINLNSLSGTINAFRISRNLQDGGGTDHGVTSGNFYLSKACFEYTDACTATTVTPSGTGSETHTIGSSFTEPTFTVKHGGTAFDPQPEITYTSSNEDIATVDDDGTVNFQGMAGSVTITAAYAGDATYCASEGHYTITVSCSDEAPKIVAASSVDLSGCNSSVTLNAKKQDGSTSFGSGTYQWYRDGEAISGATSASYTAVQAGVYTVERTGTGGCTNLSSNSATVTSERVEPEVERLVPFQYYHVDKTYSDQMKMRHLFTVKGSAAYGSTGKNFKMELSKNGAAATDVTTSNAFSVVKSADNTVDTVMIDLNKLNGKYAEDDELVLTCKAVDCEGNVSEVYKNTITMRVIGATPTLALICSGSNEAGGTRETKKLTVGGDFLTGYNVADLCQQTGNTSFDANTEWGLYTDLKAHYIVTPVNGYAVFNKLNYEPFDILLLTDYPKASKSDAAKDVLDDMAALCDYRPMLSFKTHMVAKSPSKWAAKGFTTSATENKADGRLNLNIVCYAHPMFEHLKDGTNVYRDADNSSELVYTMLSGTGYEGNKGMQGFEIDAAENFVTIGLTHYNASAAPNTPSTGNLKWTPNTGDRMLVTVAERQTNIEARFILFSINCGAQSKLTDKGEEVILACLEYLLDDDPLHVADCSFTFDNGANAPHDADWYKVPANCPGCSGTMGDGLWSTEANWGPERINIPGEFTSARIAAPVTVDVEHAKAMELRIIDEGRIDIPAGKALDVKSTIRRMDGSEIYPTEIGDIHIGSASTGNGTLIFNNNSGDTKARVDMYSKGFIDGEGVKNYQYIGTPFIEVNALYNYYGSWIYGWGEKKNGNLGWVVVKNGGPMTAWTGYCITQEAPTTHAMSGTLTATGTVDINVPANANMVVGNSWTAPIDINALTTDDLEGLTANIYFFNTGVDKTGEAGAAGSRYAGSTYVTVPVHSAPYTGDDHINSLQGFFVKNTGGSAGTLHLDYERHVRKTTRDNILSDEMHAPARRTALSSDEPVVLKMKVSGENYDDKLLLLEREDFTEGFDNGWDGDKWDGNESALYIYTTDSEGTENSVSAIPELEGTIIGFRAGEDDAYTLNFEYLNSDEPLYLYDVENNTYTQIMTGMTYRFFTTDNEKHERFIITRSNGQEVATGVESTSGSLDRSKAKKLLIEEKMFIMVNGMLYDATGKVVK